MSRTRKVALQKRSKLRDSFNLLLSASGIVTVVLLFIGVLIAYDEAPWMPHGDRANQLQIAIVAFGFGALCLYGTWEARRVENALAEKPHLRSLAALHTPWWVFFTASALACLIHEG
jgi:type VI protein secretion system component VasK